MMMPVSRGVYSRFAFSGPAGRAQRPRALSDMPRGRPAEVGFETGMPVEPAGLEQSSPSDSDSDAHAGIVDGRPFNPPGRGRRFQDLRIDAADAAQDLEQGAPLVLRSETQNELLN